MLSTGIHCQFITHVTPNINHTTVLLINLLGKGAAYNHLNLNLSFFIFLFWDYWLLKTIIILQTLVFIFKLWCFFCCFFPNADTEHVFLINLVHMCLNHVTMYSTYYGLVNACKRMCGSYLEPNEGISSHGINWQLMMFLLHCDYLHSLLTLCWICPSLTPVEGEWIETNSCHYLSVHIYMFINPAETKIKLLPVILTWFALV